MASKVCVHVLFYVKKVFSSRCFTVGIGLELSYIRSTMIVNRHMIENRVRHVTTSKRPVKQTI